MAVVHDTCPLREPRCTHITLGRVTGSCSHLSPVGNLNKFSLVEAMKIQNAYWAVSLLASRDLFLSGLFLQDAHHPPYQFQVSFLVGTTLEPEVCISKHSGVNKKCTWGSTQIVDNQRWWYKKKKKQNPLYQVLATPSTSPPKPPPLGIPPQTGLSLSKKIISGPRWIKSDTLKMSQGVGIS